MKTPQDSDTRGVRRWSAFENRLQQIVDAPGDQLDFPRIARNNHGIEAVEFVSRYFKDKARDAAYLKDLKTRANDHGVTCVLIMVDGEGDLSNKDRAERMAAVENHKKWVDAAASLGSVTDRLTRRLTRRLDRMSDGRFATLMFVPGAVLVLVLVVLPIAYGSVAPLCYPDHPERAPFYGTSDLANAPYSPSRLEQLQRLVDHARTPTERLTHFVLRLASGVCIRRASSAPVAKPRVSAS